MRQFGLSQWGAALVLAMLPAVAAAGGSVRAQPGREVLSSDARSVVVRRRLGNAGSVPDPAALRFCAGPVPGRGEPRVWSPR